ncbi:phasin [Roseibium aestuarii]|uniref:Phasin n=1 Tax=Roseibium aestuarii TaxID=2600299 RepID=A0ABW4JYN6_9HYPH|nr:phasin [Roseibium aestuarii]
MSETTTPAKPAPKARATKTPKTGAAANPFMDFEAFAMPKMEIPTAFREATEKSISQARDTYEKVKSAAEEATDLMEDSFETTRQGAVDFNHKAVDLAKSNTDAAFTFMKDVIAAKTMAEVVELQSSFARQQFDTLTAQAKDMQDFATKLSTELTSPVKSAMEKAFKDFKAA